tara:strand:- start:343 stop:873 length:531 start_codon:yes stop_codon:yes gene_type:complete
MIYIRKTKVVIMAIDATFWVAVSFIIFILALVYLKIPSKINETLSKMILDIKNEIDESEKLRNESKVLLNNAQSKLEQAKIETKKIQEQAKKDSENLILEMNDKFHKSAEIKKNLAQTKISQMKNQALKDIKNTSVKIAVDSVKKILSTSVDQSKLDNLFDKNLEESKELLKKINS